MARKRIIRRRGKKTSKFNKAFLITIFFLAQIIFLSSPLFKLNSIEVVGAQILTPQQIIQTCQIPLGKNIFLISIKSLKNKIKNLSQIRDVRLSFKAPGRLIIRIFEKHPQAMVRSAKSPEKWYYVSQDGAVLEASNKCNDNMMKIILEDEEISEKSNLSFIKTAQKASKILPKEIKDKLDCYYINSRGEVTLGEKYSNGFVKIKLGFLENMDYKLALLTEIMKTLEEKNIKPVYIDLCFSKPVVKTKK